MKPIFRTYQSQDLDTIVQLMSQLGYNHDQQSLAQNITAVRTAGGEVFVAEANHQVCGCIAAIIDIRLAEGRVGEVVSLVVDESARGHGVGKGLMYTAERWLQPRTDTIRIRANAIRKEAHRFYKNLGYENTKTQVIFSKRS